MTVYRLGCLLACIFLSGQYAMAGELFQWKDDMGHMHFTDDKSKVPMKHLQGSARKMESFKPALPKPLMKGQGLYESMCMKCHVLGFEDDGRREALGWTVIDSVTKFPKERDVLFNRLRYVVDGGVDMAKIELTDGELMAITDYMIEVLKP